MADWLIDWGPVLTAGATVVIAFFTWKAAQAARSSTENSGEAISAAKESTDVARRAAEASERASLVQSVPVIFGWDVKYPTGGNRTDMLIRAEGNGVGFNVVLRVTQDGQTGHTPTLSPIVGGAAYVDRIDLLPVGFALRESVAYTVETVYSAVGHEFRTVRESVPGGSGVFISFDKRRSGEDAWEPVW